MKGRVDKSSSSSSQINAVNYESIADPQSALQTVLTNTLPTMPVSLCRVINNYLLSNNMKKRVNDWKEHKIDSAVLGSELLEAFSYPDSRVAYALDDLTQEERKILLEDPSFPILLKFYYLSTEELHKINASNFQEIRLALTYGLITQGIEACKEFESGERAKRDIQEDFTERKHALDSARVAELREIFNELYKNHSPILMHSLFIKCTVFDIDKFYHPFIYPALIRQSAVHLNLAYENLRSYEISNANLTGANLKYAKFSLRVVNVNLQNADLRNVSNIMILLNVDLKNADLRGVDASILSDTRGSDFLDARLDESMKEHIKRQTLVWSFPGFSSSRFFYVKPIIDYLEKYKKSVSWDVYMHAMRLM